MHETTSCTSVGFSVGLLAQPLLNGVFIGLNQSQHTLLCTVLLPFVNMQPHIGVVPECVRHQPLLVTPGSDPIVTLGVISVMGHECH